MWHWRKMALKLPKELNKLEGDSVECLQRFKNWVNWVGGPVGFLLAFVAGENSCTASSATLEEFRTGIVHIGQAQLQNERESGVVIERWLGSGFVVDQHCTFVTAKHVIHNADRERVVIRFQLPKDKATVHTFRVRILFEDPESDLAFLRIDSFSNQPCSSRNLHIFLLHSGVEPAKLVGNDILIVGYPRLATAGGDIDIPVVRKGVLASTEIHWNSQDMLLLDLSGVPGFSGSPVILEQTGEVIGVVFGPGPTSRMAGFEWATPISRKDYDRVVGIPDPGVSNNTTADR